MKKKILSLVLALALVLAGGIGYKLGATTASYNFTVRMVDSLGNVLGGNASATTAAYNYTVQVVNAAGNVLNSFGSTSQGGFGVTTFPAGGFDLGCTAQDTTSTGPAGANEMVWAAFYQPTPYSFANGDMYYAGAVADASVETDGCQYQQDAVTPTTFDLVADTGLIAWGSAAATPALGGGSSNLTTQPTATTCGSGAQSCSAGIFNPGWVIKGMASVATTAKTRTCTNALTFAHGTATAAASGKCPLTITSVTLTPTNSTTTASMSIAPW